MKKNKKILECNVPSQNHCYNFGGDEDELKAIFNKNSDQYIPESVPNIRVIHNQAEQMGAIQKNGLEECATDDEVEMPKIMTMEELVSNLPNSKAEDTLLKLAGCAVRERLDAFEEIEQLADELIEKSFEMQDLAKNVKKQLAFIKRLAVVR